jgi:hypothetical protein
VAVRPGHPSTHGYHVDHFSCGAGYHYSCSGFSGPLETYTCGCCCHDLHTDPESVSDADRAWIEKVTARPEVPRG